jgi:hypothetical protein
LKVMQEFVGAAIMQYLTSGVKPSGLTLPPNREITVEPEPSIPEPMRVPDSAWMKPRQVVPIPAYMWSPERFQ